MPGRLEGQVALVTGAARGQGRSHAVRLAEEGADIIAVDICAQVDTVPFPMATPADLAETVRRVETIGRQIVAAEADVRDYGALSKVVDHGVAELGRLDIVAANAGIVSFGLLHELSEEAWCDQIDTNLIGVWHTVKAAVPHVIAGGRGGSIVLTGSVAGLKGVPGIGHRTAASLMKSFDSIDHLYAELDRVADLKLRGARTLSARLREYRESVFLARKLTHITCDMSLGVEMEGLRRRRPELQALVEFYDRLSFGPFLRQQGERLAQLPVS